MLYKKISDKINYILSLMYAFRKFKILTILLEAGSRYDIPSLNILC